MLRNTTNLEFVGGKKKKKKRNTTNLEFEFIPK